MKSSVYIAERHENYARLVITTSGEEARELWVAATCTRWKRPGDPFRRGGRFEATLAADCSSITVEGELARVHAEWPASGGRRTDVREVTEVVHPCFTSLEAVLDHLTLQAAH